MATFANSQLDSSFDNSSIQYLCTTPVPLARRVVNQLKAEDVVEKDIEEEKEKAFRMAWSEDMVSQLVNAIVDASNQGLKAQSSWKLRAWSLAAEAVSAVAPRIKDQSSWSATENGLLTADEGSFEAYFEAHPSHIKFKDTPLALANELTYLFSASTAKGGSVRTGEAVAAAAAAAAAEFSMDESVDLAIDIIDIDSLSTRKRAMNIANSKINATKKQRVTGPKLVSQRIAELTTAIQACDKKRHFRGLSVAVNRGVCRSYNQPEAQYY
nr:hypothetical protein CFP56_02607 [Quercus suber]